MINTKSRMDITFDNKAPSIVVKIPQYRNGYIEIIRRGGTIRCITEVTLDNIEDCKELLKLVTELRHLEGIKGGIAINESEYMATTVLKESKPLTEVIYSNAEEMVAQGQYIFDTLWKNAVPANKKIREIEEGRPINYKTQLLNKSDGSLNESELGEILSNAKEIDIVTSTEGLQVGYEFFQRLSNRIDEVNGLGDRKCVRVLVEVSKNNLELVKKYIDLGIKVCHLKKEPPIYFAVTNTDIMASIERLGKGSINESIFYSNDPIYIKRFKLMFERLWTDSRAGEEIAGIIQKDEEVPIIEAIESSDRTIRLIRDLISTAKHEILGILPSFEAFRRQVESGMFEHIRKVSQEKKLIIKVLVTDKIELPGGNTDIQIGSGKYCLVIRTKGIDVRHDNVKVYEFTVDGIETMTVRSIYNESIRPQMGMVVVDKSRSIVIEPKESRSKNALDYIGMSSYSNSSQISKSYATMFDTLWNYAEMFNLFEKSYERLKTQDKMQREFIDIVAHELRTPLQSILGLTEIVKSRAKDEERDLLETVTENGARLHRFIENVLTTTKLEGFTSNNPRDIFDLNVLILDIVNNYQTRFRNMTKATLSDTKEIQFKCQGFDQVHKVKANKLQISMVISNIIDNAINFIPAKQRGWIIISVEQKDKTVLVQIKDNGEGIHLEILPRLFTKFATKSFYGSGLGLYTCRKIIHLHHGGIWAQNNPQNEQGATFSFSLPLVINSFKNSSRTNTA
ncbi:sensor histidine kinase [Candidatus Nitrosocosmicus hydrocola]|uniref:sensor histidine kinase n=1 Tax=Candidatus Nitrosocosmicus hydrocola TaxID=1826872 RepID=UPI0011E5BF74|nr:HAMP domain-containing sensor histidine kinase [Candidatus Nitrosocosmicus hydrocola]